MEQKKYEPKPTDRIAGRSPQVHEWLKRAGICAFDGKDYVKRVVIDIDVDSVVKVYVERLATRQMLMVEPLDFSRNIIAVDAIDNPDIVVPEDEGGDATAVAS